MSSPSSVMEAPTPAVSRLLLVLAWHIRAGAPVPLCINNLTWPHQSVSVQVGTTNAADEWARRFGLGVSVNRSDEFVCVKSESAQINGATVHFWAVGAGADYRTRSQGEKGVSVDAVGSI